MVSERKFSLIKNWQMAAAAATIVATWAIHGYQIVQLSRDVEILKEQVRTLQVSVGSIGTDIGWIKNELNRKHAMASGVTRGDRDEQIR